MPGISDFHVKNIDLPPACFVYFVSDSNAVPNRKQCGDEITVIESGGARYPQAVDCSPLRRINLAIRWMIQGSYGKSFGKKTKMADALANEIINASKGTMDSFAMGKKNEAEKQADAAR